MLDTIDQIDRLMCRQFARWLSLRHEHRSLVQLMFPSLHLLLLLFLLSRGGSVLLSSLPSSLPTYLLHVWTPPPQPRLLASDHSLSVPTWPPPVWARPSPLPPQGSPIGPRLLRRSTPLLCSGGSVGRSQDPSGGGLPPWGGTGSAQDGGHAGGSSRSLRQIRVSTTLHGVASYETLICSSQHETVNNNSQETLLHCDDGPGSERVWPDSTEQHLCFWFCGFCLCSSFQHLLEERLSWNLLIYKQVNSSTDRFCSVSVPAGSVSSEWGGYMRHLYCVYSARSSCVNMDSDIPNQVFTNWIWWFYVSVFKSVCLFYQTTGTAVTLLVRFGPPEWIQTIQQGLKLWVNNAKELKIKLQKLIVIITNERQWSEETRAATHQC